MSKGIVLSDIHLFSSRSDAFKRLEDVYPIIRGSNLCVLNGDVFDFRWTILASIEETVKRAAAWLEDLLKAYPDIHFIYICGNHDSHPLFFDRLLPLTDTYKNLRLAKYHVLLDSTLFLHGDTIHAADRTFPALDFYRKKFAYGEKQGAGLHYLFKTLIALKGPNVATALINKEQNCQLLTDYINLHLEPHAGDVKYVYYGHTHNAFRMLEYQGRKFTNTGSMITGLKYLVETFDLDSLNPTVLI